MESLFAGDAVVSVKNPNASNLHAVRCSTPIRITVTPEVLRSAKRVVVMAYGPDKADVLEWAQELPKDVDSCPARTVLHGEWVVTTDPEVLVDRVLGRIEPVIYL